MLGVQFNFTPNIRLKQINCTPNDPLKREGLGSYAMKPLQIFLSIWISSGVNSSDVGGGGGGGVVVLMSVVIRL